MSTVKQVIVAIDIGSSSVRCSAYVLVEGRGEATEEANESYTVLALENCRTHRSLRLVQPNTGKIQLLRGSDHDENKSFMDLLDDCMDDLLETLRNSDIGPWAVVAIAFSALVMNLVGVDAEGSIVGEEASVSYACNSPEVARQCHDLRM